MLNSPARMRPHSPDLLSLVLDLAAPRTNVRMHIDEALALIRAEFRAERIALLLRSPGSLEPIAALGPDFPVPEVLSKWNPGWTGDPPVPGVIYCPDTRSDRRFAGAAITEVRSFALVTAELVDAQGRSVTAILWLDGSAKPYLCSESGLRLLAFACRGLGNEVLVQRAAAAEEESFKSPGVIEGYLLRTPMEEIRKAMVELALKQPGLTISAAARRLGIPRRTLYGFIWRWGLGRRIKSRTRESASRLSPSPPSSPLRPGR